MSFNIQRDGSNKPVFKSITNLNQNSLLNALLNRNSAGSPNINFTSVTINNVVIDSTTSTKLTPVTDVTAGTASASKALVLDSSRNIAGINKIYCTQIYINNVLLDPSIFSGGAVAVSTQDANRSELSGIAVGSAQANKAIVLDKKLKVSGLSSLDTESAESGGQLLVNSKDNSFEATGVYMRQRVNNIFTKNDLNSYFTTKTNTGNVGDMGTNTLTESDYSHSLKIHVGAFSNNSLAYSYNGIEWKLAVTFTSVVAFVAWFPDHSKFLGVGGNYLYESSNGINWTATKIAAINLYCICWSPDLQMYVIGGEGRPCLYNVGSDLTKWYNSEGPYSVNTIRITYIPSSKKFLACTNSGLINLLSSNDGKIWTVIPVTTQNQGNIKMIAYSPTMDIIVMPSGASSGRGNRVGFYSKDGGFSIEPYYYNNIEFNVIKWIGDLGLFIATSFSNQQVAYSHDGINWRAFEIDSSGTNGYITCITYDRTTKKIYLRTQSNGQTYLISYNPLNNPIANFYAVSSTNCIGLNSTQTNAVLNLGNDSGNMIKVSTANRQDSGNINLVNGELVFKSNYLQFTCKNLISASGKKFNLGLIPKTNKFIENPYYFDLYGDNKKNCLVKYGSSKEITLGGYLCVSGLTIGGSSFTGSDNIAEFANCELGKATASRFLLATYGNLITGINKISCKSTKINNYIITSKERTDDYVVDFKNKYDFNLEKKNYGLFGNIYNSTPIIYTTYFGTAATNDKLFYIKEMDLLLGFKSSGSTLFYKNIRSNYSLNMTDSITTAALFGTAVSITRMLYIKEFGNIYICTTSGLFYSKDGYSWDRVNMMTEQTSSVDSITYSPELDLIVIANANNVMISKNGIDFKSTYDNRYSESLINVMWISSWRMFVGISRTQSLTRSQYLYSYDGIFWDFLESNEENVIKSSGIPNTLVYSPKLDMLIAMQASTNNMSYTYNGKVWYNITTFVPPTGVITWIDELEVFIMSSSSLATTFFYYSYDGIEWIAVKTPSAVNTATYTSLSNAWIYIKSMNTLVNTMTGGTAGMIVLNNNHFTCNNYSVDNAVCEYNENLAIDIINNRVGIAKSDPQFSLELGEDLAFKPTSSAWATSSDQRLKEHIMDADINVCYDNIKNIPLKHYTWNDDVYNSNQISDRSQLGWIAQDVENIIPKAVERKNMHGLTDCRTLNNDQIIANLYGAVQKLIQMDESMEEYFV
jgi:hypothetical protein